MEIVKYFEEKCGKICIYQKNIVILPRFFIMQTYNINLMKEVISANLKALRSATGYTMEQVARMIGVERSAYANYESGMREMPLRLLEKAADLFGVELALLFEKDNQAVDNMLLTAFRVDELNDDDLKEVAHFKRIVKNYLKLSKKLG